MADTDNDSDGDGQGNNTPTLPVLPTSGTEGTNAPHAPEVAAGRITVKATGKIAKTLAKISSKRAATAVRLGEKAEEAAARAAQRATKAGTGSNFFTKKFNNFSASQAERSAAKAATNATKAEASAARAMAIEERFAGAKGVLGKVGWAATVGFAAWDIYNGYKQHGWKGAASAAIDTAVVAIPAIIAGDLGATAGAAVGSLAGPVGTVVGGVAGGAAAGYYAGSFAQKYILPWAHKFEAAIGLPTPDSPPPNQQQQIAPTQSKPAVVPGVTPQNAPTHQNSPAPQVGSTPPTPETSPADVLAAAQKGDALFKFNSADLSADERAALLTADRQMLHQIAEAKHNRSHAKINLPDGQVVDFDGSKDGKLALEVDGHVDAVGGNSTRNQTLAQMRADQAASVLAEAVKDEGLTDAVKITAKGDGLGQGQSANQQRNATLKLTGATA